MVFNFMKSKYGHKLSRNDSCPCGSGKKYKYCCLEKDKKQHEETYEKAKEALKKALAESNKETNINIKG